MSKPVLNTSLQGRSMPGVGARRNLIIGQVANGETAGLFENVHAYTKSQLDSAFGVRTELRNRVQSWIDSNKRYAGLDVQALEEDDSAVASAGAIGVTGTATESGELEISIVSESKYNQTVDVAADDDAAAVITKIVNAFSTSNFPDIPVDITDGGTEVTITAVDKGTVGNYYSFKVKGSVPGIDVTLTDMTAGATDPSYSISDIPDKHYTGINAPEYLDIADVVAEELDNRFNTSNKIYDGVCFSGKNGSVSDILTYLDGLNSKSLVIMGNKLAPTSPAADELISGSAITHPNDWTVSEFMGIRAIRLTDGAPVSDYVQAGGLDTVGGKALASLPYFNTVLGQTPVTAARYLFTESEKRQVESAGYAVVDVNPSETAVITGGVRMTYNVDDIGNEDKTFRYLNFVDTGSVCREYIFNRMKADLAQQRLTAGDLIPGRNIKNDASIEALYMEYYGELAEEALLQAGSEVTSAVRDNVTVKIDMAERAVTLIADMPIVTQIGSVNVPLTMVFSIS